MSSDNLILIFEPDNPCNTTITNQATEETLYVVSTTHDGPTVTTISNAEDQIIASWQWRDVRSDILTMALGSATPVSSSAWLKKSMIPFNITVSFTDLEKRKFKWKGNGAGLQLKLYSAQDKRRPIAWFTPPIHRRNQGQTPPATDTAPAEPRMETLVLNPTAQEIQNLVVISFCMLEKSRRMNETAALSVAEANAIPMT